MPKLPSGRPRSELSARHSKSTTAFATSTTAIQSSRPIRLRRKQRRPALGASITKSQHGIRWQRRTSQWPASINFKFCAETPPDDQASNASTPAAWQTSTDASVAFPITEHGQNQQTTGRQTPTTATTMIQTQL